MLSFSVKYLYLLMRPLVLTPSLKLLLKVSINRFFDQDLIIEYFNHYSYWERCIGLKREKKQIQCILR